MTIREFTIICKPRLKRKEDDKIPTKRMELIQKYHEWNDHIILSFYVPEYETNVKNNNIISVNNELNSIEI